MAEAIGPTIQAEEAPSRRLLLFLPGILLFVLLVGLYGWRAFDSGVFGSSNGVPPHPEIEEKYGVRIESVRVAAKSGLVDLRYRVVDADKAKNFGHYTETSPLLVAEESEQRIEVTIMGLHNHRVEAGRVYYILYRNTSNALEPGSQVSIQIGDLILQHVEVY